MPFATTEKHKAYWKNRKNWLNGYSSPEAINHPHRKIIVGALKSFPWFSLVEIGCASGPNLVNIVKFIPNRQIGGTDVNPEAIAECEKIFKGGHFNVCPADDIMMSDKSADVVLTDACLLYVGPFRIRKHLQEIKRVARSHIVFCELHSNSFFRRWWLRLTRGYHAHNFQRLLESEGFYDIVKYKLTENDWPGGTPWREFGYIFKAKVPK